MNNLTKLLKYVGKYKKDTFLTWIGVLTESIAEVLVVFSTQYLIDAINNVGSNGNAEVIKYSLLIIGLALFAAFTGILAGYFSSSASAGFGKNLREAMFVKIQAYSFKNIDKFSTASIVTRTTTDVTNAQNSYQQIIRAVVRAPFMMIAGIVMCFITSPQIAWIFLVIAPSSLVALIFIGKAAHPTFKKVFETYDELNKVVEEDVDGIRVVKSFNREKEEISKFEKISSFICKKFVHAERIVAFNGPCMNLAIYTAIVVISYLGARMICNPSNPNSDLTVGKLTSLIQFIMLIMMALMMVSMVYVILMIGKSSLVRIGEILDEEPDIKSPENPVMEVKDGSIEFKNVTFEYDPGKPLLKNINLSIKSGQCIGFIGGTGSGKSSLIRLIARLYDITEGEVLVSGVNVKNYDLKVLRDSVSVVLQKNTLFSGTIRSNLLWGDSNASEEDLKEACDLAQVTPFLSKLEGGLDAKIDQGGTNVSGGQKQRLCIARALVKKPKILILDDSTSACDTATDALIRQNLQETRKDLTKIIIAQRVLSIKDCDQIFVMDKGEIVDYGTKTELRARCNIFRELYKSQLGGDFDAAN